MNHEDYCSFKLSKKLKEKGFDWQCSNFYGYNSNSEPMFCDGVNAAGMKLFINDNYNNEIFKDAAVCSAPTLSHAQKWLREVHKIDMVIEPQLGYRTGCKLYNPKHKYIILLVDSAYQGNYVDTYEQALSEGITKALELI